MMTRGPMKQRRVEIPKPVSDVIVRYYIDNRGVLLENASNRKMRTNLEREHLFNVLIADIRNRFGIALERRQIKNHWDHWRSHVVAKMTALEPQLRHEQRYRVGTGGGICISTERTATRSTNPFSDKLEEKFWTLCCQTPVVEDCPLGVIPMRTQAHNRMAVECHLPDEDRPEVSYSYFGSSSPSPAFESGFNGSSARRAPNHPYFGEIDETEAVGSQHRMLLTNQDILRRQEEVLLAQQRLYEQMADSFASMARSHERAMEQISAVLTALVPAQPIGASAVRERNDVKIESSTSSSDEFMLGSTLKSDFS